MAKFIKAHAGCSRCARKCYPGMLFYRKRYGEKSVVTENKISVLDEKHRKHCWRIGWQVYLVYRKTLTSHICGTLMWRFFQNHMNQFFLRKWRTPISCENWRLHYLKKWCYMILKKNIFCYKCTLFSACNQEKICQRIRRVQRMSSEVIFREAFLSKGFWWDSYYYWKEQFCTRRGSFRTMVTYWLIATNSLLESLDDHVLRHSWVEDFPSINIIWHHFFFSENEASIFL